MSYLLQQALQIHSKEKEILWVENRLCKFQYAWHQSVVKIQRITRCIYAGEIQWMERKRQAREPLLARFNGDTEALSSWMKQGNEIGEKQEGACAKRNDLLDRLIEANELVMKLEEERNAEEPTPDFVELSTMLAEERMELVKNWIQGDELIRRWKVVFEGLKLEWDKLNGEQEEEIEFYAQRIAELCQRLDTPIYPKSDKSGGSFGL